MAVNVKAAGRRKKIKTSAGDKIFGVFNYLFIGVFSLACVFPLFYVFMYSITPYTDYLTNPVRLFPPSITLIAYRELFNFPLMKTSYASTLFITIVGTLINVALLCISAYPLSKKHLKGRGITMGLITFTMFFNGGMIPNFLLVKNLGLLDTYWSLILPSAMSAYNLILMRNFVAAIPASLEEAAFIDGANELQILSRIIIPLSTPAIATFTLFHAVGHWNSYFNAILYISSRSKWPLTLLVREMVVESGTGMVQQSATVMEDLAQPFTLKMAIIIFTIVPILLVYPFVQKYFMKGMMLGSVKG
ncbi:MAG: carbohydrate ABC transporter permease [Oscillospiraceae bacterium]